MDRAADNDFLQAADAIRFRREVRPEDAGAVRRIVESTGFFSSAEVDVAVELIDERLARGAASGYSFVFAETDAGRTVGYACYGEIPCTIGSYDLYWIAVEAGLQRHGLGRRLLAESEALIAGAGGRRVYIETSSRAQYQPTRSFYERAGYRPEAVLEDFYAPGDDKVIYTRAVPSHQS